MNKSSGNVSKTKKAPNLDGPNAAKSNRKSFQLFPESSSVSSNRNSSAQSDDDVVNVDATQQQQYDFNGSYEDGELLVKKLQGQVRELRHKLKVLEESVDSKDYSLGTMAREKDRAVGEIRRLERSNKQLRQQLNEERNHYLEEKEKFCEEMTRYKKRLQKVKSEVKKTKESSKWTPILPISQQSLRWHFNNEKGDFTDNNSKSFALLKSSRSQGTTGSKKQTNPLGSFSCSDSQIQKTLSLESLHLYEGNDQSLQMAALKTENAKLRSIICERDERNYELCLRFLRMKHCKNDIRTRFQDLENEYLQVITNLMEKIDEARQEFNFIIDQKFKKPLHSTNAMYLRMVQRNSRMAFENASLRLENQCLKKELKKHQNEASECEGGKIEQVLGSDDKDSKGTLNDEKSKRTKKNVNFKEVRTIYQRSLTFKNSETDSNCMSKTQVTGPSNGSLTDPKFNDESIVEGIGDETKNVIEYPLQATSLPSDILNKIFKKIDTSSCQTVDSCKSNKTKPLTNVGGSEEKLNLNKVNDDDDDDEGGNSPPGGLGLQNGIKNAKPAEAIKGRTSNLTDFSTPCESKESLSLDKKDTSNCLPYSSNKPTTFPKKNGRINAGDKKAHLKLRRQNQALRMRSRQEVSRCSNKDAEDETRWFDHLRDDRLEKYENPSATDENRRESVKDSCGLQEKIDVSCQELPKRVISSKTQTDNANEKKESEVKVEQQSTHLIRDVIQTHEKEENFRSNETSRTLILNSAKKVSKTDQACGQDVHYIPSKTYRMENSSCTVFKDVYRDVSDPVHIPQVQIENVVPLDSPRSRRPESSKRFSHRLISSSPEKLRSILTESQLEACYRMAPIIVGHATTEIDQGFQSAEHNDDIVLQLVIPAATVKKSQILNESQTKLKSTLEKETSISGLDPVTSERFPAEVRSSDIRIPMSSLPTSTSTIDILDAKTLNDRSNIMLRTFSAPGLLESSWLDPYTICEMRDCSTNT